MDRFAVPKRIKKYRSLLGISQSQLANDKLSLSLIKSIESGKRNVTPLKASEIVEALKTIALSKEISIDIHASEFLMSNSDYARHYCLKKLDILCNTYDEKEYNDLIIIANAYDLNDIRLSIYTKAGGYFYSIQNYNEAIKFLKAAYSTSIKTNQEIDSLGLLIRIGACYFMNNDMEDTYIYNTKCYNELINKNIHNNFIKYKLFYNTAAYYKKLNNYSTALEWLEKTISLEGIEEKQINYAKLLKANILCITGNYTEALDIYRYLLDHDSNFIHIIYHNMAYAFIMLKDQTKGIEYLNQSLTIQLENNESTITFSLLDLGEVYYEKKKYMEAVIFYQYAFDSCIKNKQPEYICKCCNKLLQLYKLTNKSDNFYQYAGLLIKIYLKNPELKEKLSSFLHLVVKYLLESSIH